MTRVACEPLAMSGTKPCSFTDCLTENVRQLKQVYAPYYVATFLSWVATQDNVGYVCNIASQVVNLCHVNVVACVILPWINETCNT